MYRIQSTEAIHVPSYHLTRRALLGHDRSIAALPLHRTLAWVVSNLSAGYPQYVAVVAHEVVGWCHITPDEHAATAGQGRLEIGVAPAYRQRGMGTALLAATLAKAQTCGFSHIALEIDANDVQASRFFHRFGFVATPSNQGRQTWVLGKAAE